MAGALDGKSSCRSSPPWRAVIQSEPSSPGSFRTLLHTLAGGDPRKPRLKFTGADAASGGPLPSGDRHRQDALFRLRRAKAAAHLREREADALIISGV